jgi:hypothetical protein
MRKNYILNTGKIIFYCQMSIYHSVTLGPAILVLWKISRMTMTEMAQHHQGQVPPPIRNGQCLCRKCQSHRNR